MLDTDVLTPEWLWDGGEEASEEYRAYIRERTPALFLAKGILLRERDLLTM